MSITINMITPYKKELSALLKSVADDISVSTNKTVTIELKITYNQDKKDC